MLLILIQFHNTFVKANHGAANQYHVKNKLNASGSMAMNLMILQTRLMKPYDNCNQPGTKLSSVGYTALGICRLGCTIKTHHRDLESQERFVSHNEIESAGFIPLKQT